MHIKTLCAGMGNGGGRLLSWGGSVGVGVWGRLLLHVLVVVHTCFYRMNFFLFYAPES